MSDQQYLGERSVATAQPPRPRALFIGILYTGTSSALHGCSNDQHALYKYVKQLAPNVETKYLTDDTHSTIAVDGAPTRANILTALRWLREGACAESRLWCSYSGHGAWMHDRSHDELDGRDETIVPVDYTRAGQISDDLLRAELVDPLPAGARLTCIFDCCHSGTVLDLRHNYTDESTFVGPGNVRYQKKYVPALWKRAIVYTQNPRDRESNADVLMISGCRDTQTSADAYEGGAYVGALTYAFLRFADPESKHARSDANERTPANLLADMNAWMKIRNYDQRPQLSCGRTTDVDKPWDAFA